MNNRSQQMFIKQIYSLGVGLFNDAAPTIKLSENVENKILAYLNTNDILACARLNKNPWNLKMTEEIKRRKNCVTVYTWFGGDLSSHIYLQEGTGTRGTMGHSALKTYQGGEKDKGVYVSFYPPHSKNDPGSCKKSVSHFHTWYEESREEAIKIDLYGLDIAAINKRFQEICDSNYQSKIQWAEHYNCSDLILDLLKKGRILDKVDYNPFGFRTIYAYSIVLITLFRALAESSYRVSNLEKLFLSAEWRALKIIKKSNDSNHQIEKIIIEMLNKIFNKNLLDSVLHNLKEKFIYYIGSDFVKKYLNDCFWESIITKRLISGAINVPFTMLVMYVTSNFILREKYHHYRLHKTSYQNAIKAGIIALLEPITSYLAGLFLGLFKIDAMGFNFFIFNLLGFNSLNSLLLLTGIKFDVNHLAKSFSHEIALEQNFKKTMKYHLSNKYRYYSLDYQSPMLKDFVNTIALMKVVLPLIIFSWKFNYDILTTPKHVYNFAEKARKELNVHALSTHTKNNVSLINFFKEIPNKIYNYKSSILTGIGIGGLIAVGFFANKNQRLPPSASVEITTSPSISF